MSISTMRGDGGEPSLAGGVRVSKASARVQVREPFLARMVTRSRRGAAAPGAGVTA